jgi:uncharacterized protein YndB with AHSA1/START domain
MTTLNFSTTINASKEKVWNVLWNDATYRQWTALFCEGSYAESDWNEGSKIRFLTPTGEGMYGIIQRKAPFERMVFEHHGEVKAGVEERKDWGGATEGYHLSESNGVTTLDVKLETTDDFKGYFNNTFPKALEEVKRLSEQA